MKMRARLHLAYLLQIFCVLALCFSAEGAITRVAINPLEYEVPRVKLHWLPNPDANRGVVFYESFEEPATCLGGSGCDGYDNVGWTTDSYVDPDSTTVAHTDYGDHTLYCDGAGGGGTYTEMDFASPSWGSHFVLSFWLYIPTDYPSATRATTYLRNTANTRNYFRIRLLSTDLVSFGMCSSNCDSGTPGWENATSYAMSVDAWHKIDIYYKYPYDALNPPEVLVDGTSRATFTTSPGAIGVMQFGFGDTDTVGDIIYDDIAIRNPAACTPDACTKAESWIPTFTAQSLLTDASDNTGWIAVGQTGAGEQKDLLFSLATTTEYGTPKGIRSWWKGKQIDGENNGVNVGFYGENETGGTGNWVAYFNAHSGDSAYKNVYMQWDDMEPDEGRNDYCTATDIPWGCCTGSATGTCNLVWTDIPEKIWWFGQTGIGADMGHDITELWAEVIYGNASDAFLTNAPKFASYASGTVYATVRANQATDMVIRYGRTEADVDAGYYGTSTPSTCTGVHEVCLTTPVSVTSSSYYTTHIPITGLATAAKYYVDVLVKQGTDVSGTVGTPNEMKFTYTGGTTEPAVGTTVYWDCTTNPPAGCATCSGQGTVVYKSEGTAIVRVSTYSALTIADEVCTSGTDYLALSADSTHWIATSIFEAIDTRNTYWSTLPSFTTLPSESTTTDWQAAIGGDYHNDGSHWQLWDSVAGKNPEIFVDLGDLWIWDDEITFTNLLTPYRRAILTQGYGAKAVNLQENVFSKMLYYHTRSDHDTDENNANKLGYGNFGGAETYKPVWKSNKIFRELFPVDYSGFAPADIIGTASSGSSTTLLDASPTEWQFVFTSVTGGTPNPYCDENSVCDTSADTVTWNGDTDGVCETNEDCGTLLYYDPTDLIMIISHTQVSGEGGEGTLVQADTVYGSSGWNTGALPTQTVKTFPTVSRYGIYPGMIVHHYHGPFVQSTTDTEGYGVVISNSGTTITLASALTSGEAFGSADETYVIQRGFVASKFTYQNAKFILIDGRGKRDPNASYGGDKLDGTGWPFFSQTASSSRPKDLCNGTPCESNVTNDNDRSGNEDYITAQTGTGELSGDSIGDDDGNCEVGEVCVIKHGMDDLEIDITTGDMACAWDCNPDVACDTETFRGCSLVHSVGEYPSPNISVIGSLSNPVDSGTATNTDNPTVITGAGTACSGTTCTGIGGSPTITFQTGDLIYLYAEARSLVNITISSTGGQTWNNLTLIQNPIGSGKDITTRAFWAIFNGNWTSSPSVSMGSTSCNTIVMHVFRSSGGNTWVVETSTPSNEVTTNFNAAATITISAITTTNNYTVDLAAWSTNDNNTWGNISGTGWIVLGNNQYRNTSGNDTSSTFAYKWQSSAGSTNNVAKTMGGVGTDPGTNRIIAFRDTAGATTYGNVILKWDIPGLVATDRVRFFETGASSYGSDKADINAGHVQRTMVKKELDGSAAWWRILSTETPMFYAEAQGLDKWSDWDSNCMYNGNTEINATAGGDDDGICDDNEDCYGKKWLDFWTLDVIDGKNLYYATGYVTKPGALYRKVESTGTPAILFEVTDDSLLTGIQQWWWCDGTTTPSCTPSRIYVFENTYITDGGVYPVYVYHTNFWERSASRRYLFDNYGDINVINIGSDRHASGLDNGQSSNNKWPCILTSPLSPGDGFYTCRKWMIDNKAAWYHRGMSGAMGYTDNFSTFGIMNFTNVGVLMTASLYERDGTIVDNTASGHTDDETAIGLTWKGQLSMPISWSCPWGNCDYFGRSNSSGGNDGIDGTTPYDWVDDTTNADTVCDAGELCIDTFQVKCSGDGTGISHWATDLGGASQYGQIKITSTSTDGDVGLILRSIAATGTGDDRYAVILSSGTAGNDDGVCDAGEQCITWQRYDWNVAGTVVDSEEVITELDGDEWFSTIISGTGAGTVVRVWIDTSEPCNNEDSPCPYSVDRWNDAADTPDFTLTCSGTCAADTGNYVGIIIKDETGANSPTLDDFYAGDTGATGYYAGSGIMRNIMRGVFK